MTLAEYVGPTLRVGIVSWLAYIGGLVIYRLFFHPLAGFPGPKYAAISRWHEFYYEVVCKGQFTFVVQDYHRKYGPIVRIVPDEIHIQDSEFYDVLYTKAGRVDKYDWMANRFNSDQSVFAAPAANVHAVRRKALNPFFSRARIIDFEEVIRGKIKTLTSRIDAFREKAQTFSLSGFETTFHEPFMAVSISGHLSLQFPIVPKILFALPEAWLQKTEPLFARIFKLQKDMREQIDALQKGTNINAEKSTSPSVFRDLMQDPSLPASEKEARRLQDEAQLVVAAGITTVGWAMSVGAFHIISQPEVYNKLHQELVKAIPDPEAELNWSHLEKLPYLTGCIREAVRLSYPVSTRNPRLLSKPLAYKDWVIPARTPISMTIVDVSNDEAIFPQHERFDPERWIGASKTADGESLDRYFICFQKGTRSCLGVNLAYAEMYLTLASVFRKFRFELYETDQSDVELAHDFFLPSPKLDSKGIRVKCVQRF